MHWTQALHVLEHVVYSVERKLISTRYKANENAPISVQIPKNSYKNSHISPQLLSWWAQGLLSKIVLSSSFTTLNWIPKFWLNKAYSWPALFQNSSSPSLNCYCPPGTQGKKHIHLARLSWLRADLNRTEGACERSQSILLDTLVTMYYQISTARRDGERHCSCTSAHSCYLIAILFAKRRTIP